MCVWEKKNAYKVLVGETWKENATWKSYAYMENDITEVIKGLGLEDVD
jgi:hypothetical protein